MKNIILAIMFVFSVVWSQDASARTPKHKKKPAVTAQKKRSAKHSAKRSAKRSVKTAKKVAKKEPASSGYRSSYLRKKRNRSIASEPSVSAKKSKKKRKHSY